MQIHHDTTSLTLEKQSLHSPLNQISNLPHQNHQFNATIFPIHRSICVNMACLKEVNRSASVAFAPDAPYFAAGTMAGAVDSSFSSSANLDIFKLDFRSDDRELPLVGMVPSSEPFNRLSWGKKVSESNDFPLGLIAGGLVDGNIGVWNPACLISSESNENAFVQQLSRHKGPVRGLEFNPHTPQNLASGADEGEILIWDLSNPNAPTHFPPLRGTGTASQLEISFVSWNMKVAPILASTSLNGTTVVWDLRRQKPVISFSDSVRRRCSVLQWSPEFATQLVVASDEDSSPALRVWDMRNTMSPVKELLGHTKGVVAMSWCLHDSAYLLTCAKDNRTICWDTNSGEIVSELPAGTNWNFDVHWYPKIPGVISASSFDGKIGIYNVEACSRFGIGEGEFMAAPLRAPKWYKRRSGVSFGFGGKLLTYKSADGTNATTGSSEVHVHTVVTEQSLVSSSSEFESAMQSGDKSSLRLLCDKKTQESESEDDKETWGFLKVMFEEDVTARTKLLSHLGFTLPVEEKKAISDPISQELNSLTLENNEEDESSEQKEANIFSSDNGEDFFNNLPSPKADTPVSNSVHNFSSAENSGQNAEELQLETDGQDETLSDPSFDEAVQRALVVGDYKGAVAQCIIADRMADALVIAHAGGASLWESTRDQYLKMSRSPYLKVVSAMVNNDLLSLVNTRPLKSWKETLALLCSFAQQEEWDFLCDTLASRLMTAGNSLAATLCFICAGNIDKTVEIWSKTFTSEQEGKSYLGLLQDLMEKTIVLALASRHKRFSASLCKLVEKYAEILASQGLLTTAMEYLKLMGSEDLTPELIILHDSIALATEREEEMPAEEFKNSQPQKAVNPADQFRYPSQPYYVEPTPSLMQTNVPYGVESHPLNQPYGRIYNTPTPYQPAVQPNMFVPSQDPQIPQLSFTPPPVSTQPAVIPFTPSTPPVLKNVEQYQQPTLGSQLYPQVNHNSTYQSGPPGVPPQVGSTHGHKISQVVAPTPRGFMPVNVPTGVQRPGMNTMHPSSPTRTAPVQPAIAPAAPPPTVHTADTSNVPADQKAAIATLKRLFNETSEALGGQRANPAKKREIEDNSRKLGALFAKLNIGDISKNAGEKLVQLCQALDNGDFSTASQIQVRLSTNDWEECSFWLVPLKRMIKTRQSVR